MITKEKVERLTNQRKIILDYLKSVITHPSAEEVYLKVKKKLPRISLGTVYRNLNVLKGKGEIREIPSDVAHFDGNITPHSHFFCDKCKKIFDVFDNCEILKNKKTKVGKIKHLQVYFYGICKNCQKK
jgi:Fe2+ or Zn2+ uptake regulation protein